MKNALKKLTGLFLIAALVLSFGSMLEPIEAGAYCIETTKTWENAVETLTMTGGFGITGAQSGGSYTEDPWNSGHGTVYRLHATSSPGAQVGRDKSALSTDNHAFRMESNTTYRITFDYMWGAGSASSIENGVAAHKIGLVWGEQLNGGSNTPRKKFHDEDVLILDDSNSTLETVNGQSVRKLTSNTKWSTYSHEFTTSGSAWNDRYTSLIIQNNCDNSSGNILNDATLFFDNVKVEKLVNSSAKQKQQVVWVNATEVLDLESGTGITGCQGNVGQYVSDPRNEGHGTVYKVSATSSNSFQIGRDGNALATDNEAFKMESGSTYKISFDFMWGKGSTSSVSNGVGNNEVALVWGSQLNGGSNTPRQKFLGGLDYYTLDNTNSAATTIGGYAARMQTTDSQWMHTEYTFTASKDSGLGWRDHYLTLMIQNNCDNSPFEGVTVNNAHLYVDNIVIKRAVYVTPEVSRALIGDANLDGQINSDDAIACLYGTVFEDSSYGYSALDLCDYNNDDTVTTDDAAYLLYNCVFSNDVYPIKGNALNGSVVSSDVKYQDYNGNLVYRVVYPSADDKMKALTAAQSVAGNMQTHLGQTVNCISDSSSDNNAYEILIGNTNRSESHEALTYLYETQNGRKDDFVICTINNKIVINAYTESALAKACDHFNRVIFNKNGNSGGINFVYGAEHNYNTTKINGVPIHKFKIINATYNTSYILKQEIEALTETVTDKTGYYVNSINDSAQKSKYEIIVGTTNRSGQSKITDKDQYSIKISGQTVYLNGGSIQATAMAVSEFGKMLKNGNLSNRDSVTGSYNQAIKSYDLSQRYHLTWGDDFELDSSDDNRDVINGINYKNWWVYRPGEGYDVASRNGRTMIRSWDADVVHSEDGLLHIHAKYDDNYYYASRLATVYTMAYKYGYAEMSAIMPEGSAFWVAFWGSSYTDSGSVFGTEIDIFEYFGDTGMEMGKCNLHGWMKDNRLDTYNNKFGSGNWVHLDDQNHWALHDTKLNREIWHPNHLNGGRLFDEFHTYGYLWTPNRVDFTFDGEVYLSLDLNSNPVWADTMNDYQYLIISEAVCSLARTTTRMEDNDPRWETNNFDVDYVHVYQLDDGQHGLLLDGAKP